MGFSRQEYWSGVPLPSPSALPKSPLKMQVIEVPFRPIELEWTGAQESVLISLSGACSSWRTQNHLFKLYLYHRASSAQLLNCVQFSVTPWTVACQALLSKGFPRQEYWSRLPFLPPGDLPDPGNQTHISYVSCIVGGFFTHWATWETLTYSLIEKIRRSNYK